jgi:membrane-associated phospholipid phosphatase
MQGQRPYFLRYAVAVLLATIVVCIVSYFFVDIPLALHFEKISPCLRKFSKTISHLIDADDQYLFWPVAYFFFRCLMKKEAIANRCLLIVITLPLTNVLVGLMKAFFGRARPELFFASNEYGLTFFSMADSFQSLPSGHACSIGALFGAFACFYPKAQWPLLVLALLLASVRIILTQHYLSDMIAGVVIGFLVSSWIYWMMKQNKLPFSRK